MHLRQKSLAIKSMSVKEERKAIGFALQTVDKRSHTSSFASLICVETVVSRARKPLLMNPRLFTSSLGCT
ncbi:hypothetical protein J1TS1_19500 [Shouchella clausii]|nr:hypothetical protein J1TS1_19500 [Shouchella clausii]